MCKDPLGAELVSLQELSYLMTLGLLYLNHLIIWQVDILIGFIMAIVKAIANKKIYKANGMATFFLQCNVKNKPAIIKALCFFEEDC